MCLRANRLKEMHFQSYTLFRSSLLIQYSQLFSLILEGQMTKVWNVLRARSLGQLQEVVVRYYIVAKSFWLLDLFDLVHLPCFGMCCQMPSWVQAEGNLGAQCVLL